MAILSLLRCVVDSGSAKGRAVEGQFGSVLSDASALPATPRAPTTTNPRVRPRAWTKPDGRRTLQLVLATLWLFDGLLQMQSVFFTRSFGDQMIATMSAGNPHVLAAPIHWSGMTIGNHAMVTNALFAFFQVALALGIAWRPTLKPALVASIAWSIGVWWIGEGLGGVLNGGANPVNGGPGSVIIYGLLAVLLWPRDRPGVTAPFVAARAVGVPVAKGLWVVLWGSMAYFALDGANRSSTGLHDLILGQTDGEPGWVVWIDRHSASMVDHHGLAAMVVVAVLLAVVAVGVFLPPALANATLVLAIVVNLWFWVVGQDFGALFTNGATDINTAPLLIVVALAYWKTSTGRRPAGVGRPSPVLAREAA
jgi:hypothetical protein